MDHQSMGSLSASNLRSPSQVNDNTNNKSNAGDSTAAADNTATTTTKATPSEKGNTSSSSSSMKRKSPSSSSDNEPGNSSSYNMKRPRQEEEGIMTSLTTDNLKQSALLDHDAGATTTTQKGFVSYREQDVLSGRGGKTNCHFGNRQYRELILSHLETYDKAGKSMKPVVSRTIVQIIRDRGGRFLSKGNDGLYYDIGDEAAREKASQALRHRTFEKRSNKNKDDDNNSNKKSKSDGSTTTNLGSDSQKNQGGSFSKSSSLESINTSSIPQHATSFIQQQQQPQDEDLRNNPAYVEARIALQRNDMMMMERERMMANEMLLRERYLALRSTATNPTVPQQQQQQQPHLFTSSQLPLLHSSSANSVSSTMLPVSTQQASISHNPYGSIARAANAATVSISSSGLSGSSGSGMARTTIPTDSSLYFLPDNLRASRQPSSVTATAATMQAMLNRHHHHHHLGGNISLQNEHLARFPLLRTQGIHTQVSTNPGVLPALMGNAATATGTASSPPTDETNDHNDLPRQQPRDC